MQRILVIAYYFPPMGMSGVQRVAKFVKYLPEFGWAPTVLTVDPGGYFAFDDALLREVSRSDVRIVRTKSFDPTRLFKKKATVALPAESSRKWLSYLSQALFVPDNKIGWLQPAVKKAVSLHQEAPFDIVLATIPPYTGALVAHKVARKTGLPYVIDFRDDWLDNPRHVYPTPLHRSIHRFLERRVVKDASALIFINEQISATVSDRFAALDREGQALPGLHVIPQGFDRQDFAIIDSDAREAAEPAKKLRFLYSGVFYDAQTPDYFLNALRHFIDARPDAGEALEAVFVGLLPERSRRLIEELALEEWVHYAGYRPHEECVRYLLGADVLWMTVGRGAGQHLISTSKLFEYFGAGKPILGLVPEGAAQDALHRYGASWIAPPDDVESIEQTLARIYTEWKNDALPRPDADFVRQLERRYLTGQLSSLLRMHS